MTNKQRSISYRNGVPGYFTSRGVWKELSDKRRAPRTEKSAMVELRIQNRDKRLADYQRDLHALRAENARLREALEGARVWIAGRTSEFADPRFTDRYGYADSGRRLLDRITAALKGQS